MNRKQATSFLFVLFIFFVFAVACNKEKTCTINCSLTYSMHIFGVGYQNVDLDTIVLNEYTPNTNFTEIRSTKTFYPDLYVFNDSERVHLADVGRYSDWELYIPATQTTYRISHITEQTNPTRTGDCASMTGCYNEIVSFELNGQDQFTSSALIHK